MTLIKGIAATVDDKMGYFQNTTVHASFSEL